MHDHDKVIFMLISTLKQRRHTQTHTHKIRRHIENEKLSHEIFSEEKHE